jgi:hypothetical protein
MCDLSALCSDALLHVQDAEESAGNVAGSVVEPLRVLGDASVICRDPSAMHLLAAAAIQVGRGMAAVLPQILAVTVGKTDGLLVSDTKPCMYPCNCRYTILNVRVLKPRNTSPQTHVNAQGVLVLAVEETSQLLCS